MSRSTISASRVWTAFEEINGSTRTGKHTVEEYAAALVRFMEQEDFYHKLEADVEKFRAEGDSNRRRNMSRSTVLYWMCLIDWWSYLAQRRRG